MNQIFADAEYVSNAVQDDEQGFVGLELHKISNGTRSIAASIIFWDATGHFALQTFHSEIPLPIVESLIAEAKATIKTQ
jgi:hypothetical protein